MTNYSNITADSEARLAKINHEAAIAEFEVTKGLVIEAGAEIEKLKIEHEDLARRIGVAKTNAIKATEAHEHSKLRLEEAAGRRFGMTEAQQAASIDRAATAAMASNFSPRVVNGN